MKRIVRKVGADRAVEVIFPCLSVVKKCITAGAGWLVDVTSIGVLRKRTRTDRHLREPACKAILQRIWNLLGELIRSVGHNGFAGYLLSF
jgi:hypothetical protein